MTRPLTSAAVKRLVAAGESETLELKRTTGELRVVEAVAAVPSRSPRRFFDG
jgi:hypothetical protein